MNKNQFNSLLTLIVPQIIDKITENSNITEINAINQFYHSRLYSELSDEETKLWHYSPLLLYTMYQDELLTGTYDYPEEA
ncbi:MAG: hypothetical protein IJP18_07130 [Oscillospiraceae bacterium]|nr:hypothetical protein [Oscillospiraceae bacterium]MBQ9982326.1 hypothetical protein [Oscillospiraceae bacterium]